MKKPKKEFIKIDGMMKFFLFVLAIDFIMIILAFNNYYLSFSKPTHHILPVLLTLISFYALAYTRKIERIWFIMVNLVGILFLLAGFFFITYISYDTIESPTGNVKVMIGHRDISLGETNHFYEFYLYTSVPGLVKKVGEHKIMTRDTDAGNLKVLGVDNAEWIDDEKVIFPSPYAGAVQIEWKRSIHRKK